MAASPREALRRQRRRELDARRSKSRVRLGACLQRWGQLKEKLGLALHSELAQHLLESYFSKVCVKCSGGRGEAKEVEHVVTSAESLQCLVLQVHRHGQQCSLPPILQLTSTLGGQAIERAQPDSAMGGQAIERGQPKSVMGGQAIERVQIDDAMGGQAIERGQPDSAMGGQAIERGQPDNAMGHQVSVEKREGRSRKGQEKRGGTNLRLRAGRTEERGDSALGVELKLSLRYACEGGHVFTWCPSGIGPEGCGAGADRARRLESDSVPSGGDLLRERGRRGAMEEGRQGRGEGGALSDSPRRPEEVTVGSEHVEEEDGEEETLMDLRGAETGESRAAEGMPAQEVDPELEVDSTDQLQPQGERAPSNDVGRGALHLQGKSCTPSPKRSCPGFPSHWSDAISGKPDAKIRKNSCALISNSTVIRQRTTRGKQREVVQPGLARSSPRIRKKENKGSTVKRLGDEDISQISGRRKRKATPRDILPCEFDGCGKIFSSRQYLNHHMKYQHVQQKSFSCSQPSCGKSFNFKKHLKEHQKLHSNQRDYICEFCARAFRTSSNLIIHRRIHTGEKPLQCEVCGFTCRQKASLNWHMRKHDAESGYQFPCEICGRRFEKRDNVTAHRSKSHPEPSPSSALAPSANPTAPSPKIPSPLPESPALLETPSDPALSGGLTGQSRDPSDLPIMVV
ncbi:hypothetical protein GJAV_G00089020 [Gymnothorax javanicus]|nr:hypothetical protein GJAV_G00089020 [Gymnothorax javanicus]